MSDPTVVLYMEFPDARLPTDIVDWIETNVSAAVKQDRPVFYLEGDDWWVRVIWQGNGHLRYKVIFRFTTMSKALLFKLTWG